MAGQSVYDEGMRGTMIRKAGWHQIVEPLALQTKEFGV